MFQVGIIGCGKPWKSDGATGFGMSHAHAIGYNSSPDTQIVALSDIVEENALAFQAARGGDRIYADYHEMLAKEQLDIVSIATWPHLHAPMVIAAAEAGVKGIYCEKPMGVTFGECRQMVEVCEAHNVALTFNHQRRFAEPFTKGKALLDAGDIGDLQRIEGACPDLFDWGTHWFDMMFKFNDETPAEWVIGQVDMRDHRVVFGVTLEGHGISHVKFSNGVDGLLLTGAGADSMYIRVYGSDGMLEMTNSEEAPLRVRSKDSGGWQTVAVSEGIHGLGDMVARGVHDLIAALKEGREPELSGRRALATTEVIFGTYESSRRRGRVDFPLTITDSPLHAMLANGDLAVN